jgi:hypothetical protein
VAQRTPREPPRIWALLGAHPGDNDQVIALAEALGRPFELKRLEFNRWRILGPRLLGSSLVSLTSASRRKIFAEPPPDVTISAGHRSVAAVRALRELSGGRTRSIHVGFPRISPAHFELVIATPQYPIADHPNLLRIPIALTRVATDAVESAEAAELDPLPRPRRLLMVGGRTFFWDLDQEQLLDRLSSMIEEVRGSGGSVLVTTSPRTPPDLGRDIARTLNASGVPFVLTAPGKRPTLATLLAVADAITVTADSVSMVSDAIWTGRPVELVPARKSALGKVAFALNDAFRPGGQLYPQDLRYFWRSLKDIGISERLATPRISPRKTMELVLTRVRPIVERVE